MLDSHTHSYYSMDSSTPSRDMVERAIELGLDYLAITDHYNADYIHIAKEYRDHSKELKYPLDIEGHIADVNRLKAEYGDRIYVALGLECGYADDVTDIYADTIGEGRYDVIVNSIHTIDHGDIYDDIFYKGKSREYIYRRYLEEIRKSVDAPYNYNIIGHIGYLSRKAPYENNLITMDEFGDMIDDILRAIVSRGVALECNSKSKNTPYAFLPGIDILKRYYELGGRRISFGSDAHTPDRIGEKYDIVSDIARSIGFEGFTYYIKGEPHLARWQNMDENK